MAALIPKMYCGSGSGLTEAAVAGDQPGVQSQIAGSFIAAEAAKLN